MLSLNKIKFEIFVGWVFTLIVLANVFCPAIRIITGVLLKSQNYMPLILVSSTIILVAYLLTIFEVAERV